jgi:ATPase family associated with various cellular activities (AAA)/Right handed beta helix region/AAA lid domain
MTTLRAKRSSAMTGALAMWLALGATGFVVSLLGIAQRIGSGIPAMGFISVVGCLVWAIVVLRYLSDLLWPRRLEVSANGVRHKTLFVKNELGWAEIKEVCLLPAEKRWGLKAPLQRRLLIIKTPGMGSTVLNRVTVDLRPLTVTADDLEVAMTTYAKDKWLGETTLAGVAPPQLVRIPFEIITPFSKVLLRATMPASVAVGAVAGVLYGTVAHGGPTPSAGLAAAGAAWTYILIATVRVMTTVNGGLFINPNGMELRVGETNSANKNPRRSMLQNQAIRSADVSETQLTVRLADGFSPPRRLGRWGCRPQPDGSIKVAELLHDYHGHRDGVRVFPAQLSQALRDYGYEAAAPPPVKPREPDTSTEARWTVHVDPAGGRDHLTIAAALRVIPRGHGLILIEPGRYNEPLTLKGDLELRAARGPRTVLIEPAGDVSIAADGRVTLDGLDIVNRGVAAVSASGRLTIRNTRVRANGEFAVRTGNGTTLDIEASEVTGGRVAVSGGTATITGTSFDDASSQAITADKDATLTMDGCTVRNPRGHGLDITGSAATISHPKIEQPGGVAIRATEGARLTVTNAAITGGNDAAIACLDRSRATITGLTATSNGAGIDVRGGSEVTVTGSRFTGCRGAGASLTDARGTFTDCRFDQTGGAGISATNSPVEASGCSLTHGRTGVTVTKSTAKLARLIIEDTSSFAIAISDESSAAVEETRIRRCDNGVSAYGDACRAELKDVTIRDALASGVVTEKSAQVTIEGGAVRGAGVFGLNCRDTSHVTITGTTVEDAGEACVLVNGSARLVARLITVAGSRAVGLLGRNSARLDVADSVFRDCAGLGIEVADDAFGQLTDCLVTGNGDENYTINDRIRTSGLRTSDEEPSPHATTPEEGPLAELAELIGLDTAKEQVAGQVNLLRLARWRREAGLAEPPLAHHLVFSGPPGTGKTTVARLYAKILAALGALEHGHIVEVTRGDIVGEFLGHTAQKTRKAFRRAHGGVLFIDEAYALARKIGANSDFGQEAIDELTGLMENDRDKVVVIAAGYPDEMRAFLDANPGLRSRFSRVLEFDPYSAKELAQIVAMQANKGEFILADGVQDLLVEHFGRLERRGSPANARDARTIFETMVESQAARLGGDGSDPSRDQLMLLLPEDMPA